MAIIGACKATQLERHDALSPRLPPSVPTWLCGVSRAGATGPSSTAQARKRRSGGRMSPVRWDRHTVPVGVSVTRLCSVPRCD